jgi:hypothetical protein
MIVNLLALLVILATGAVAGVLLTVRYAEHRHAQLLADEDGLADVRDPLAEWATLRNDSPGRREPSAFESRDRLSI